MIDRYSIKYKIANILANNILKQGFDYFISKKPRASVLIKLILKYDGKVLVGKKIEKSSLSKICLPYGYANLEEFEDNISACARIARDKTSLSLDVDDFSNDSLLNITIDYNNQACIVYQYEYNLKKEDLSKIYSTYSMYDFFLLDLSEIKTYKNKGRFITQLDYKILKNMV